MPLRVPHADPDPSVFLSPKTLMSHSPAPQVIATLITNSYQLNIEVLLCFTDVALFTNQSQGPLPAKSLQNITFLYCDTCFIVGAWN